uniref:Uncharacterized protein n=1 Tax=Rhizophora mucronata TaxID=61149 RepID=A0A2P2MZ05_RHIMU
MLIIKICGPRCKIRFQVTVYSFLLLFSLSKSTISDFQYLQIRGLI